MGRGGPWWMGVLGVLAALTVGSPRALAEPVRGEVLPMTQPDGTALRVRIWGDEFYTVVESFDGYTLTHDVKTGYICYARLAPDGTQLVSTRVPASQAPPSDLPLHLRITPAARAAQARAARLTWATSNRAALAQSGLGQEPLGLSLGNVRGLTLLVDFDDDPNTIPPSDVDAYCNEIGYTGNGNNGSVRDYFYDVSGGLLTYTNYVPVAYYRALQPKSYYTDPNVPFPQRALELITEALNALDAAGLDFSQYDADQDGTIDAINCFYAGFRNSAWATGLWPHSAILNWCADGVCSGRYQMSDMQGVLRLSTFCHENGHMLLDWPDLYDYGYESNGVGFWCLMSYPALTTNPQAPCAYLKLRAGWANVSVLTAAQNGVSVPAGNSNVVYKLPHPTASNEYFLIENRQKTGRDVALPGSGLAIWHIDDFGSNDYEQGTPTQHYQVALEQADGQRDLERAANYGDTTDLYGAPTYTQWTDATDPNSNWWSAIPWNHMVTNISSSDTTMTFDFSVYVDCNGNGVDDVQDIASGTSQDCNGNGVPDECDLAAGTSQDCNADGVPDECEPDCDGDGVLDACELAAPGGLVGEYFDNADFTGLRAARIDPTLDFDWGTGAPWPGFAPDTFSARWSGYLLTPAVSGAYTFHARSDDGVRLWLAGQLVIDQWSSQGGAESAVTVPLVGGQSYPIHVEYYENAGPALLQLSWQPPGGVKEVLPAAQLRPAQDCNANGVPDTCDIAAGSSTDLNGNGIPDECEPGGLNAPPVVSAGPDLTITLPAAALHGTITDDGLPAPPGLVAAAWSVVSGPGLVLFGDLAAPETTATFALPGTYVLRLAANDGQFAVSDTVSVLARAFAPGDLNCDGLVNNGDIDPFVAALTSPALYASTYPDCDATLADLNGDGLMNNGDIDAFVGLLTGW